MNAFRTSLLSVASASLLTGVGLSLLPKGRLHGVIRLVGALILIAVVVAPVIELDAQTFVSDVGEIKVDVSDIQQNAWEKSEQLFSQLIKERCESYILDRAARSGIELEVQIIMGYNDQPYPVGARLSGHISDEDKRYMSDMIEQDLGIPIRRQEWSEIE